ncbi:hypothetical protein T440DRAFT_421883 [Plenodomus tracheiphilus IPT5]|uniref:Uncharacterized protein n=1 Tax=Plenodomus tracheiphilus IPT5 TaxID=1408161 RepID=A0A6A7BD42_9PLEO|nr:hypothetical protein T440DRAFT_421883 [Plenodomus tracheiphilus IPT5]
MMTANKVSWDLLKHNADEASHTPERDMPEVKQLTVTLKLPSAKLATVGANTQMSLAETSDDTQLGPENGFIASIKADDPEKQDARQEDSSTADANTSTHEATTNDDNDVIKIEHPTESDGIMTDVPPEDPIQQLSRAGSTKDGTMQDARPVPDQAKITTEGNIKEEHTEEVDTTAPVPMPDGVSDAIIYHSSHFPQPTDEQRAAEYHDAACSDGHLSDKDSTVVQVSASTEPITREQQREDMPLDAQDQKSEATKPALSQQSQVAEKSLPSQHQDLWHETTDPVSQQSQSPLQPAAVVDPTLLEIQRLEHLAEKRKEALHAARARAQAMPSNFAQGGLSMASALPVPQPVAPQQLPGAFFNHPSYLAQGYPAMNLQYPTYDYPFQGHMPRPMMQTRYPPHGYAPQAAPGLLPGPNGTLTNEQFHQMTQAPQYQLQQHASTAQSQYQSPQSHDHGVTVTHSESDSEDLPLNSHTKLQIIAQHQSTSGPIYASHQDSSEAQQYHSGHLDEAENSSIEAHPKSSPHPSSASTIDFALPRYAVDRQPLEKKDDIPSAKISIPGLVREELLLSPDHADQEIHLLLNLFLPAQQLLATPDPEPATAVLNFHNIAVMVIEAFVQFEIGDEFGTGRGHWHTDHDNDAEGEYIRVRDAKDANPDDIFFAVVDRWRAGIESGRKGVLLIRGAQEFCDVALDIIYYVKEHGLLRPELKGKKGKGKEKDEENVDEEEGEMKGKKRGAQKVNEVQPRKRAKTEKPKTTPVKGGKSKVKPKVVVSKAVRK